MGPSHRDRGVGFCREPRRYDGPAERIPRAALNGDRTLWSGWRSGYSVAGIVLGLILGKIGEQSFAPAMQIIYYDPFEHLNRPIGRARLLGGLTALGLNVTQTIRGP